jgi:hypothetical protein
MAKDGGRETTAKIAKDAKDAKSRTRRIATLAREERHSDRSGGISQLLRNAGCKLETGGAAARPSLCLCDLLVNSCPGSWAKDSSLTIRGLVLASMRGNSEIRRPCRCP